MQREQVCVQLREEKRESVSEFLPSVVISGYTGEQENTNPGR